MCLGLCEMKVQWAPILFGRMVREGIFVRCMTALGVLMLLSAILFGACQSSGSDPPVTQLPPGPVSTTVACTPLQDGMNLQATFRPPRSVWLEMEGFEPGEPIRFIVNLTMTGNRSSTFERLSEEVVGVDGRFAEEIELNVPIADIQTGEIQVIYEQGAACAEIANADATPEIAAPSPTPAQNSP